jgi:type VI secretion system protein ImpA
MTRAGFASVTSSSISKTIYLNLDFAEITKRRSPSRRQFCFDDSLTGVFALNEFALSAALDDEGNVAVPATAAVIASDAIAASDAEAAVVNAAIVDPSPADVPAATAATIDPAVAALCVPLSGADPCGPDLDLEGDGDYLNFFAQAEGLLPSSFFSSDDGRPFDRASVDLPAQVAAIGPLWDRSRDLRLLVMRARLLILNRDLAGFAVTIAAIAHWLDEFWDGVHPRAADDDCLARSAALGALDLPTVVFPLQYAQLCDGRRVGTVSYRAWMIAIDEAKPRLGEQKHASAALTEAIGDAPPAALAATRRHVAMLKSSLARIRETFLLKGSSLGLDSLSTVVDKLQAFIDPRAAADEETAAQAADGDEAAADAGAIAGSPTSLAEAQQALAAIADYYSRSEPSSPTLPLVRQAHQLIGKSFFEVMSILVPTQMEKAAFQIGADQFFELPVGKLSKLTEGAPSPDGVDQAASSDGDGSTQYRVQSRAQAIALLDQVQRFFRHAEPSSPVPMLCDRARALAERDFMGVLREVLPKAALKTFGAEK